MLVGNVMFPVLFLRVAFEENTAAALVEAPKHISWFTTRTLSAVTYTVSSMKSAPFRYASMYPPYENSGN